MEGGHLQPGLWHWYKALAAIFMALIQGLWHWGRALVGWFMTLRQGTFDRLLALRQGTCCHVYVIDMKFVALRQGTCSQVYGIEMMLMAGLWHWDEVYDIDTGLPKLGLWHWGKAFVAMSMPLRSGTCSQVYGIGSKAGHLLPGLWLWDRVLAARFMLLRQGTCC